MDIKSDVPLAEPLSPLDLRTDLRMLGPGSDPGLWERQLQQELLLIQKQQQIQKQLLISEFQKQHEKLTRQHQAQLQEHLKVSIALNSSIEDGAAVCTMAPQCTTETSTTQHGILQIIRKHCSSGKQKFRKGETAQHSKTRSVKQYIIEQCEFCFCRQIQLILSQQNRNCRIYHKPLSL